MYSYKEYYDCLTTEETKDIVDVDLNLTYYCMAFKSANDVLIGAINNDISVKIGDNISSDIESCDDEKIIGYIDIYTLDNIADNIYNVIKFEADGIVAVKINSESLVLKTKTNGHYLVTNVHVCSIDAPFDRRIFSIESFCRNAIVKNVDFMFYTKNITDEMIRYAISNGYGHLFSIWNPGLDTDEMRERVAKIRAKYKL